MEKDTKSNDIDAKKDGHELSDLSLHSDAIKKNLDDVNMEPWYYIYGNFINPELKKKKDD